MEEDPFFYRKFSVLLELTIADYKQQRISEAQYLAKVKEIMESVRDRRKPNLPSELDGNDFAQALYGAVSEQLSPSAGRILRESPAPYGDEKLTEDAVVNQIRAEMSLRMEEIIRKEAVVRWRDNPDAQNRMRNQMDDFLFELQKTREITLSLEQMDSLIESCLNIARNRPNDV